MTRATTISALEAYFDDGHFTDDLARRVAARTESQVPEQRHALREYLDLEVGPTLDAMGFEVTVHENPDPTGGPLLVGRRIEDPTFTTVLTYGHGDVVRGMSSNWRDGLDPWTLTAADERLYGRGVADNKGQHSVNFAALRAVIDDRGRLGFNSIVLIETSEEIGSPGLHTFVAEHTSELAADVLIASDGPRVSAGRPTIFLGSRGALDVDLVVDLRDGAHHSGNWGGLLANPGVVLANAIASIIDQHGEIRVRSIVPAGVPEAVRRVLADCDIEHDPGSPAVDTGWGEPGLTPVERLVAWNTFEVLAFRTGDPDRPVNAIPPRAVAQCQIRYTVDSDPSTFVDALRDHFVEHGFPDVTVSTPAGRPMWAATRLDPADPWVERVSTSIETTTGRRPAILPNLGGSIPNDAFTHGLGMPTVWVPHSYGGCSQHAPDEHVPVALLREALGIMGGLFWDIGSTREEIPRRRR